VTARGPHDTCGRQEPRAGIGHQVSTDGVERAANRLGNRHGLRGGAMPGNGVERAGCERRCAGAAVDQCPLAVQCRLPPERPRSPATPPPMTTTRFTAHRVMRAGAPGPALLGEACCGPIATRRVLAWRTRNSTAIAVPSCGSSPRSSAMIWPQRAAQRIPPHAPRPRRVRLETSSTVRAISSRTA